MQSSHWSDDANPTLWHLAVKHAVFLVNHMPDPRTRLYPSDVFTKTRWEQKKLTGVHVWGCPVYVLDKMISVGKKLPGWTPCSTCTVNLGLLDKHPAPIPLVIFKPQTGYIPDSNMQPPENDILHLDIPLGDFYIIRDGVHRQTWWESARILVEKAKFAARSMHFIEVKEGRENKTQVFVHLSVWWKLHQNLSFSGTELQYLASKYGQHVWRTIKCKRGIQTPLYTSVSTLLQKMMTLPDYSRLLDDRLEAWIPRSTENLPFLQITIRWYWI